MAYRGLRGSDPFVSKTSRNERFAQMSKQEQIIQQKKLEIQAKMEEQKAKSTTNATPAAKWVFRAVLPLFSRMDAAREREGAMGRRGGERRTEMCGISREREGRAMFVFWRSVRFIANSCIEMYF